MPNPPFSSQTEAVRQSFGTLNSHQLNWQPAADSWSIGLCLLHLITTNQSYFDTLDQLAAGTYQPGFWGKFRGLSRFWGKMLIEGSGPEVKRKMKAPRAFRPAQSQVGEDIVDRFQQTQQALVQRMEKIQHLPAEKVIIASPANRMLTYSLADAITLLYVHEQRHIQQAQRVLAHPQFPSA